MSIDTEARPRSIYKTPTELEKLRTLQRSNSERKKRLKLRISPGNDWPLDAKTLTKAEYLETDDVHAPPMPEPVTMRALQREAARVDTPGANKLTSEALAHAQQGIVRARHSAFRDEMAEEAAMRGPWTIERVDKWLVRAMATLFRLPLNSRPSGFKSSMPNYVAEFADMVARQENKSLRRLRNRLTREMGAVTAIDYRRMEEAAQWQARYLRDLPDVAKIVGYGALWNAIPGKSVKKRIKDFGMWPSKFYALRKEGLIRIAVGLTRDGKVAT